jgi:hypothetical protein
MSEGASSGGGGTAVPAAAAVAVEMAAPAGVATQHQPSPSPSPSLSLSPSPSPGVDEHGEPKKKALAPTMSSTGQPLPTLQDYISYIKLLYAQNCWRDAPSVDITYDKLSYTLDVSHPHIRCACT